MLGGIPPSEAGRLSIWEFTAIRTLWNRRHKTDKDDEQVEAPDLEYVIHRQAELRQAGIAGSIH